MGRIQLIYEPKAGPMSVAVFVSGSGTNFVALYEEQKRLQKSGATNYGRIDAVFTNAPRCTGAEKAKEFGIPLLSLNSKSYFDVLGKNPDDNEVRDYYDAATVSLVEEICTPSLVVLAGYRRRLGSLFMKRYKDKIINLYPGDTTKPYLVRGVDASVQALRAGGQAIKCTVFLQRENDRFGPALVQSQPISLEGLTEKDAEEMQEKVRREGEWKIFPFAVHHLIASGRIGIDEEDGVYVDGERVSEGGYQFREYN